MQILAAPMKFSLRLFCSKEAFIKIILLKTKKIKAFFNQQLGKEQFFENHVTCKLNQM